MKNKTTLTKFQFSNDKALPSQPDVTLFVTVYSLNEE